MRHQSGLSTCVLFFSILLLLPIVATPASTQPIALSHFAFSAAPARESIVGIASFYDEAGPTASGEAYDPTAFTAAALMELRDKFGGIQFGRLYRPAYAIAEYNGRRAILKFNDVGPLKPGRKFDLSRAAMEHFGGIEKGLLPDFKVTLLPAGEVYTEGPLIDDQLRPFDGEKEEIALTDMASPARVFAAQEPTASISDGPIALLMEHEASAVPCDTHATSHAAWASIEPMAPDEADDPVI